MKSITNYSKFTIPYLMTSWIINLGIRKQPRPYKRSKGGMNLFHKIHTRILDRHYSSLTTHNSMCPNPSILKPIPKAMDKHRLLNLSHVNAHSITNKINQFQVEVCDNKVDICAITETWIKKDSIEAITKEVPPLGYKIFSKPRTTGKNDGGLALVYKDYLTVNELITENHAFNTMEIQGYHIRLDHILINLYATYRIPRTSIISFCDEFSQVLEEDIAKSADKTLLVGDFNIHVDDSSDSDTITFMDLLDSYNMLNKVTFPTHVKHHSLDLVMEDGNNTVVMNVKEGLFLSDHCFVHSTLNIIIPKPKECVLTFRKLKSIDHSALKSDIEESLSKIELRNSINVQQLVGSYNTILSELLEKHAPLQTKKVKQSHRQPWFDDRIRREIILRRKKERTYRNDPTEYNLNAFYQQCRFVSNIIKTAQRTYYTEKLADDKTNFKWIFEISNKLLYKNEPLPLPLSDNKKNLADQFNEFFITKIDKIMDGLVPTTSHPINNDYIEDKFETDKRLQEFRPLTLEETIKLVKSAAPKSCKLNPIPTIILLEHLDIIAPTLQEIINLSLLTGNMPQNMKEALLCPLLKKPNLDLQQFKNFRLVSNLSFVSKLIERAVCDQLLEYKATTGKLDGMQSAYHADHSTEMALLKVKTDILNNMDNKKVNFLILLDLSVAFDTVLFHLLMNRLLNRFGITGTVLKWIESYLTERTQRVMIDEFLSDPVTLKHGVLQGSVLEPILYTLFTSPVGDISRSHNIGYHGFADDTQNYHSHQVKQEMKKNVNRR